MKIFRKHLILLLLSFSSNSLFSQTQSLWSVVNDKNIDSIGLHAKQYQVPLWGDTRFYFNPDTLRAAPSNWLARDFNNDGYSDVFITFFTEDSENKFIPFKLYIYDKNTGGYIDKSFKIKNNIGHTFSRKSMAADFNGDGILDVVAVNCPECPTCPFSYLNIVLSNKNDTTWVQKLLRKGNRFEFEGGYHHGFAIGDIDADGDNDIILCDDTNSKGSLIYLNDGKGNFLEKEGVKNVSSHTMELADINGDGCLDMLFWYNSSGDNIGIKYGDCKGSFNYYQSLTHFSNYPHVMDFEIVDLDKDRDMDLILTTTDYWTGWELTFLENDGVDSLGNLKFINHTEKITNNLKASHFYLDKHSDYVPPYIQVIDINFDGKLDIIPQQPLNNVINHINQWILINEGAWNYKYRSLPFIEPVKQLDFVLSEPSKVILRWKTEILTHLFQNNNGGINKWAIYISDSIWGDRSEVIKAPIIVNAKDVMINVNMNEYQIELTNNEMYIRIAPIDSFGIEFPLSNLLKIVNIVPIANAGKDQIMNEGMLVNLDGSASSDPDRNPLTFKWTAPPGITLSSNTTARPTFTTPEVSINTNYTFFLIVNDGLVDSPADQVVITVKNLNKQPLANAGTDQSVNEGATVSLDGSSSSDPDGNTLAYKWTAPSGIILSSITAAKPTFIAPEVKKDTILVFSLIVNDGLINSESSTVKITVKNVIKTGSEILGLNGLVIFPNPTNGIFNIEGLPLNQNNKISVHTIDGKIIKEKIGNTKTETIDISDQVSGTYLLNVNDQSFKILKK
jgi:hypothetical protein